MYVAARYGHRYALTTLLKFGALVNSTGDNIETPLHVACRKGYDEIVHDLLMYGADVHSVDKRGNTPLHTALLGMANKYHSSEIVENLLSRGALVNKKNNTAKTPLCIASENGLKDVTQILVKAFADTNLQDSENDLPLHLAIRNGHTDIVEIFLKSSNNIDRCNAKGITPRMLAKNHEDILKIVDAFERTEGNFLSYIIIHISSFLIYAIVIEQLNQITFCKFTSDSIKSNTLHVYLSIFSELNKKGVIYYRK